MARKQEVTSGVTARKRARSLHQPVGRWIRPDARLAIYLRDDMLCLACGRRLNDADPRDVTLDHIVPKVDGGSNKPENLYMCCRSCNCSRQDKPIGRFLSPEALAHVERNRVRDINPYRKLAKALIEGRTGDDNS
jgi:5-methylcytosine-specific restriction endonuclease McrA